jgi:hypothetical protein
MRTYSIPNEELAKKGSEEIMKIKLNKLERAIDYPEMFDKVEAEIEFAGSIVIAESIGVNTEKYKEQFTEITRENFGEYFKMRMEEVLYR